MGSSSTNLLTLLVFKNTINPELIRSLHVYQLEDGGEKEVEREFLFSNSGSYLEMASTPLFSSEKFRATQVVQGYMNGLWRCIFAFHADDDPPFSCIPPSLLPSRNTKLKSIRSLAKDLQKIIRLCSRAEESDVSQVSVKHTCDCNGNHLCQSSKNLSMLDQDLNCLPYPLAPSELQDIDLVEMSLPGNFEKSRRAASERIAKLALSDLVKYFDIPIIEASKSLNVGLTVLKRKCRELGIPRWPHRKIKSLDSLIHDLQEEAKRQEKENKVATMAVTKRQKMLENEREIIERKPFMELQRETKRFRQDVFKRRHRARVLKGKESPAVTLVD